MARIITDLHPKAQMMATKLVEKCERSGLKIAITSCIRDEQEQLDCFNRGTSPFRYPNSMHNWGVAFDVCRNDGAGAYNNADGFFEKVGKIGLGLGLIWGGAWQKKDRPHFQLSDWGIGTYTLAKKYGTPAKFKASWVDTTTKSSVVNKVVVAVKKVVVSKSKKTKVKELQIALNKSYGFKLKVDGIVGSDVKSKLKQVYLKNFVKNEYVKWVQEQLRSKGYNISVDGMYGDGSEKVVRGFQREKKLTNDGMFGYKCAIKLIGLL